MIVINRLNYEFDFVVHDVCNLIIAIVYQYVMIVNFHCNTRYCIKVFYNNTFLYTLLHNFNSNNLLQ